MNRLYGDRGQAVPAVGLVILVLVVALLMLAHLGGATVDRARARTAADAAALAAAGDTDEAAASLAAQNGAELVEVTRSDRDVEVVVRVGEVRATARARVGAGAHVPDQGP